MEAAQLLTALRNQMLRPSQSSWEGLFETYEAARAGSADGELIKTAFQNLDQEWAPKITLLQLLSKQVLPARTKAKEDLDKNVLKVALEQAAGLFKRLIIQKDKKKVKKMLRLTASIVLSMGPDFLKKALKCKQPSSYQNLTLLTPFLLSIPPSIY